jgi:predicted RNase H-like nuclease
VQFVGVDGCSYGWLAFESDDGQQWVPRTYLKKKPRGFDERLAVLAAVLPSAQDAVDHALRTIPRHDAARDDILDALVAGLTAARPPEALATLPTIPPKDAAGLPMEMVFYQGEWSGVR